MKAALRCLEIYGDLRRCEIGYNAFAFLTI